MMIHYCDCCGWKLEDHGFKVRIMAVSIFPGSFLPGGVVGYATQSSIDKVNAGEKIYCANCVRRVEETLSPFPAKDV